MSSKSVVFLACFFSFLGFILPALFSAPVSAEETIDNVDEVMLVTLKRPFARNDYAGATTLLDGKALDPYLLTIVDIANSVPGLFAQDTGLRNPTPTIMRGVNFEAMSGNNLGGDTYTVASYLDSIPLQGYYAPPQIALKDLDSVEVLRGPQGTLYGASSLSGLIGYQTAKPVENEFSIGLHGQVSQTDHSDGFNIDSDIVVNAPLVKDTLTMRTLLSFTENSGFIDNEFLLEGPANDINDDSLAVGRISFLLTPTEPLSLSVMLQNQKIKSGDFQADNPDISGRDYAASTYYRQPMEGDLTLADWVLSYQFDVFSLQLSANFYQYELMQASDITAFYQALGYTVDLDGGDSGINDANASVDQRNLELRLVSHWDSPINGVAGISVTDNNLDFVSSDVLMDSTSDNAEVEYTLTQDQVLEDIALFGELTWNATERLTATIGGRYFKYSDNITTCDGFYTDPLLCLYEEVEDDEISLKLSTLFKVADQISFYAGISEGFRRGGANAVPDDLADHRTYKPDTTVNYELGIFGSGWGNTLDYSATLFSIHWSDVQLFTGNESADLGYYVGYISNANDARSDGIEIDFSLVFAENFRLSGFYAYSDARLVQDSLSYNDDAGLGDNGYRGDRLPGSPKEQARLMVNYSQPWRELTLDAGISCEYTGDINTQLNAEHYGFRNIGGHSIFNLDAGVSMNSFRFGMFVKNVANRRIVTSEEPGLYGPESAFNYILRPRTIGLDARYFLN